MPDHRNSWEKMLPASAVHSSALRPQSEDLDPVCFMFLVEIACTSTGQLPLPLQKKLSRGLEQWVRNGGSLDAAFGWRAGVGQRNRTPQNRGRSAAAVRGISLIVPVAATTPDAAARAALPVLRGELPAATAEAAAAIKQAESLGVTWPSSVSGLRTLIVDISAKS